jgi:hypothetical protein
MKSGEVKSAEGSALFSFSSELKVIRALEKTWGN